MKRMTPIVAARRTSCRRGGEVALPAAPDDGMALPHQEIAFGLAGAVADHHRHHRIIGQRHVDAVAGVEIDETPEVGEEAHLDELHLMLAHGDCQQHDEQETEADERGQRRPAKTFHHHHVAQADQLGSTGEGPDVADDFAARRFMFDRDGAPVEADVSVTRHGIFSRVRWRGRAGGRPLQAPPFAPAYRALGC